MSKLINVSIDVTKIPREKIIQGQKGGKYVSLDVWIEDEPNQWGKDASVSIGQTKEEREQKARKVYCGNGKKLFGWGGSRVDGNSHGPSQSAHNEAKSNGYAPQNDPSEPPF